MRLVGRLTHRSTSRRLRLALLITGVLLVLAPVTALAAVTFTDVPTTHTHYAGIMWAAESGVTIGSPSQWHVHLSSGQPGQPGSDGHLPA